jgi:hypothetical protein
MQKPSPTNTTYRKYVLVDKPIFSKEKEGSKLLFKREENKSYAFAIKKFFLKPFMRAEAKKQIVNILKSEIFENSNDAKVLLAKINSTPFWKGVKTEEFLKVSKPVLERAALGKNDVFCEKNTKATAEIQPNLLRDLLGSEFPEPLDDFDTYQKDFKNKTSPDENEKHASADECEEDFSSFESEEDVSADESTESDSPDLDENENFIEEANIQIESTAEKYELAINNKIFEAPISHKNSKKEPKEKELIKKAQQEYLKKENEQLKVIQEIEQDELAELMKKESISLINELDNLRKNIKPDELKEIIKSKLARRFNPDEDKNKTIFEGLNELISHINNPNKEYSFESNKKINVFMRAIEQIEDQGNGLLDLKISQKITKLFSFYAEKYEDARLKGNLAETIKAMHPELENPAITEKQNKLAQEIRIKLKEIRQFNNNPNELEAFIDYFKNPSSKYDPEKMSDYEAFLNIFYKNISQLDRITQTHCLNVADQLEGELQIDWAIDFEAFDDEEMEIQNPEIFKLVNSLKEYDAPSSSLLSFFYYLKDGKSTINSESYWKLLQFAVNQNSAMQTILSLDQIDFFKELVKNLMSDLREYATRKNINKPANTTGQ